MMDSILIIEDDEDLREGLTFVFSSEGYEVKGVGTLRAGMAEAQQGCWSLVILDCNLPDGSGYDFLREIQDIADTPVFMLTARDTELDEVKALSLGVADFMSKPFSLAILKARVHRILGWKNYDHVLASSGITLDKGMQKVQRHGEDVTLSKTEFQLLWYLVENREHVLSKEQLLAHVWDADGKFVDENTLSVTISRLRAKIEVDPKHPVHIRTVHGIGYVWKEGEV